MRRDNLGMAKMRPLVRLPRCTKAWAMLGIILGHPLEHLIEPCIVLCNLLDRPYHSLSAYGRCSASPINKLHRLIITLTANFLDLLSPMSMTLMT